jgi:hypothetical protein
MQNKQISRLSIVAGCILLVAVGFSSCSNTEQTKNEDLYPRQTFEEWNRELDSNIQQSEKRETKVIGIDPPHSTRANPIYEITNGPDTLIVYSNVKLEIGDQLTVYTHYDDIKLQAIIDSAFMKRLPAITLSTAYGCNWL